MVLVAIAGGTSPTLGRSIAWSGPAVGELYSALGRRWRAAGARESSSGPDGDGGRFSRRLHVAHATMSHWSNIVILVHHTRAAPTQSESSLGAESCMSVILRAKSSLNSAAAC